ncbi:DNA repair protein RecO [Thalassocella blandensis]|nr:DNA repair protein RecO [Thalassocella blandensis]
MATQQISSYLLHCRKYTDSRVILDLLTSDFGLVSGVFRLKTKKKITTAVPSFTPLLVSWGRGQALKTITDVEPVGPGCKLSGITLFAAMYVNELMLRLLAAEDSSADVLSLYQGVLLELEHLALSGQSQLAHIEVPLRKFELMLLANLGYGISFSSDAFDQTIEEHLFYRLDCEQGFVPVLTSDDAGVLSSPTKMKVVFEGKTILSMAINDFSDLMVRREAKTISRMLLKPLLGDKPLKSRELFSTV